MYENCDLPYVLATLCLLGSLQKSSTGPQYLIEIQHEKFTYSYFDLDAVLPRVCTEGRLFGAFVLDCC